MKTTNAKITESRTSLKLGCCLPLLLGSGFAIAQSTPPTGKLEDVKITGSLEPNFSDGTLTSSQGVIDADALSRQNPARASDLLEAVPGLVLTQHSGGGKANQYFLRGFSLDHGTDFSIKFLGAPLNLPAHAHGQGYADSNMLIPELVERLEYRKGPYFAQDGDFSTAGALNIDYLASLKKGLFSLSVGEYGFNRALIANSTTLSNKDTKILYALEYQTQDGPWEVKEDLTKYNVVLGVQHRIDSSSFIQVNYSGYKNDWTATDHIPVQAVNEGKVNRFGSLDPTAGGSTSRHAVSVQYSRLNADSASNVSAYLVDYELDLFSDFSYGLRDNTIYGKPGVLSDQFNQFDNRIYYGASANHTLFNNLSFVNSRLSFGADFRTDDVKPTALYDSIARERFFTRSEDELKQTSIGVYVAQQVSPIEWLKITPGLRYDRFSVDLNGQYDDDEDNLTPNIQRAGSRNDDLVSPKLSVALGPFQGGHEFFIAHGRGFHSNDPRGLFTASPVDYLVKTQGSELVWANSRLAEGLKLSATLFNLKSASELVFVGDAGTTEPKSASRRNGAEFLFDYDLRNGWDVHAHLNYVDAKFQGLVDDEIPNAVKKSGSVELTKKWSNYQAGYKLKYVGSAPLTEDGSIVSNSLIQSDIFATTKVSEDLTLTLSVFNLFDRENSDIEYAQEYALNGTTNFGKTFHPSIPRHVRLTAKYSF